MNSTFVGMSRVTKLVVFLFALSFHAIGQDRNDWILFEHATFKEVFVKEFFTFKSLLTPDESIEKLEGDELVIIGYYIPVATKDNSLILSKTPFASCFFCGSAGQETVIDVRLKKEAPRNYLADDKIKVRGRLQLNTTDWETLSFILLDAEILTQ
jgi:hypothetical protein